MASYIGRSVSDADKYEFIECDAGITGEALGGKILGCLRDSKVDMTKARGHAYVGAGYMSVPPRRQPSALLLSILLPSSCTVHHTA